MNTSNQVDIQQFYFSAYLKLKSWIQYSAPNFDCFILEKDRIYNQITGMAFVLCDVSDIDSDRLTDMANFVINSKWHLS